MSEEAPSPTEQFEEQIRQRLGAYSLQFAMQPNTHHFQYFEARDEGGNLLSVDKTELQGYELLLAQLQNDTAH